MLEKYLTLLYGMEDLDFENESPFVRLGKRRNAPRLILEHPLCQTIDPAPTLDFIKRLADKKVILLFRDPREVVYTYFFRLRKRIGDPRVQAMDLGEFIRHPEFGIERIIDFFNLWHRSRSEFRGCLVLRFEDLVDHPSEEMARLLAFLEIPIEKKLLDTVIRDTPDRTTTAVEERDVVFFEEDRAFLNRAMAALDPELEFKV